MGFVEKGSGECNKGSLIICVQPLVLSESGRSFIKTKFNCSPFLLDQPPRVGPANGEPLCHPLTMATALGGLLCCERCVD